jgi:hypothetical protein
LTTQVRMFCPTLSYNLTVIWTVDWVWSGNCAPSFAKEAFYSNLDMVWILSGSILVNVVFQAQITEAA